MTMGGLVPGTNGMPLPGMPGAAMPMGAQAGVTPNGHYGMQPQGAFLWSALSPYSVLYRLVGLVGLHSPGWTTILCLRCKERTHWT